MTRIEEIRLMKTPELVRLRQSMKVVAFGLTYQPRKYLSEEQKDMLNIFNSVSMILRDRICNQQRTGGIP